MSTAEAHKVTEGVYKNLVDNFNSGIRQVLLTGKAYHKSLQSVSSSARAYNDALARLGSVTKECKGGTEEIGDVLVTIASTQKEIQAKYDESAKALFTELILPLEHKLDHEFRRASTAHRKYQQGHKTVLTPYNKAFESLKKFRKKTRNKFVYDNEKEAQYMRTLSKCQEKLDEYRLKGLQTALLEERKCHCFLLNRLCAISGMNANIHRRGMDLYSPLPEWRQLCAHPSTLPESALQLLSLPMDEYDQTNGGPSFLHSNGFLHRDTQSLGSPFRRSISAHDIFNGPSNFDGAKTLPNRPMTLPPPPPTSQPQVQAIYTHVGSSDAQLAFQEGDLITLVGNKSEGWQYGQNIRTNRLGWFPLSFTKPVNNGGAQPSPPLHRSLSANQRVKSVGDLLDSRSLSDASFMDNDMPGNVPGNLRRPKSLYDGPSQIPARHWPHAMYQGQNPHHTPHRMPPSGPLPDPDQIYQAIPIPTDDHKPHGNPRDEYAIHTSGLYNRAQSFHDRDRSASPPLPPPPPSLTQPLYAPVTSSFTTYSPSRRQFQSTPSTPSMSRVSLPAPPALPAPPPPPPPPPPSFPATSAPPPPPPPPNPSSLLSQNSVAHGNPSAGSSTGYGSPARQQNNKPPPPPPHQYQDPRDAHPPEDYGAVEENVSHQHHPMFSTVSLRKTKTNDRSAPKI